MNRANLVAVGALAVLASCGPRIPPEPVRTGTAPSDACQFLVLDPALADEIHVARADASRTPDGRLSVRAEIQNETERELHLEVRTTFQDSREFGTADETPFRRVLIPPGSIRTYEATSFAGGAADFLVEIRRARR